MIAHSHVQPAVLHLPRGLRLQDLSTDVLLGELAARGYSHFASLDSHAVFDRGGLWFDAPARHVRWQQVDRRLSRREAAVVQCLIARHPAYTRAEDIALVVWGAVTDITVKAVRVYIRYLRRKLPGLIPLERPSAPMWGLYRIALED